MAGVESWEQVGARVREARLAAGVSQVQLAGVLGIDRSALVRIERGQRQVSALELFRLSDHLGVPVAHFVTAPLPAIVSQRLDLDEESGTATRDRYRMDAALEAHARDAEFLRTEGYLSPGLLPEAGSISSAQDARGLASATRSLLTDPEGPLPGMADTAETFGLYLLVVDLPGEGASLRLDDRFGVAVISASAPAGRRRFTAAHELAHHLVGDEYTSDIGVAASRDERESVIDAFAAELLLPESAVVGRWDSMDGAPRHRVIRLAGEFRVSWTVAVNTALHSGVIDHDQAREMRLDTPQRGDFIAVCGAEPSEDLLAGQTGSRWRRAVLRVYDDGLITPARTIELLHGALAESELPDRDIRPRP